MENLQFVVFRWSIFMYNSWFYLIISKMYSRFVSRCKRENVDLFFLFLSFVRERKRKREREKRNDWTVVCCFFFFLRSIARLKNELMMIHDRKSGSFFKRTKYFLLYIQSTIYLSSIVKKRILIKQIDFRSEMMTCFDY